jgi:hypothetical protein
MAAVDAVNTDRYLPPDRFLAQAPVAEGSWCRRCRPGLRHARVHAASHRASVRRRAAWRRWTTHPAST